MKVLFITHSAVMGGGELSLLDLAKEAPWERSVLFLGDGPLVEKYEKSGIDTKLVSFFSPRSINLKAIMFFPFLFSKVLEIARRYDLLYSNSQKAHFACFLLSKLLRKKWIVHYRDDFDPDKYGFILSSLSRSILNNGPKLIIANSKGTLESLKNAGVKTRIEAVYNFINFSHAPSFGKNKQPLKRLFYPSRLSPWKGQLEFLNALKHVTTSCEVDLIGEGLFGEKQHCNFDKLLKEMPAHIKVNVHPFQKDISNFYKTASFVVHLPVKPEPFGRVTAEAVSFNLPVIVSRYATIDGLIKDGVTGFVTENLEPRNIALKIDEALNSDELSELTARVYEVAKDSFSKEKTLLRVYALVEDFF